MINVSEEVWAELARADDYRATGEDYLDSGLFDDMSLDELTAVEATLGSLRAAIDLVRRVVKQEIEFRLVDEQANAFRRGDLIYMMAPKKDWKARDDEAVDSLLNWAGDEWRELYTVSPSTRVKKTGLRALAEKKGMDLQTLLDTFIHEDVGDMELQIIPIDRAPSWLQTLEEGATR